jgi:cytochrome c peroxidase
LGERLFHDVRLSGNDSRSRAICHSGWRLTDDGFHDIGLSPMKDRGRGEILADPRLDFAMKTPSLRDVARLAPYMHDGRFATLEDVVRHYKQGIEPRRPFRPN